MNYGDYSRIDRLRQVAGSPEVRDEVEKALQSYEGTDMDSLLSRVRKFEPGEIYSGQVVEVNDQMVVVDIGYKSEGFIPRDEFEANDELVPGDAVDVLLDNFDEDTGDMILSKRKADRIRGWETVTRKYGQGDEIGRAHV